MVSNKKPKKLWKDKIPELLAQIEEKILFCYCDYIKLSR